jgi:formamidopyrimidine-DNA glycosylase
VVPQGGLTGDHLAAVVTGRRFTAARRIGKLLLLDTDDDVTVGLRFGMTGRLLVDGVAGSTTSSTRASGTSRGGTG